MREMMDDFSTLIIEVCYYANALSLQIIGANY